ncbi:TetR/AcrR family transcriptional regulator [Sphingomonas sp. Leaf30]|uniref:TetR/AcrR family transcriptional regulator n=1 Tax=Sphingomonas sp. Leaf30 TaxID=1736213 RepID=UPI0012E2F551|nr:TetR/AcrR family transcriptional regulator [Sphingomonas sp. Leaf30]
MVAFNPGVLPNMRLSFVRRRLQLLNIACLSIETNVISYLGFFVIAKSAGITASAIYRYFPDLDALMLDLREHFFYKDDLLKRISSYFAEESDFEPVGVIGGNSIELCGDAMNERP